MSMEGVDPTMNEWVGIGKNAFNTAIIRWALKSSFEESIN